MESQPNRWPITIFHISDLHFGREDSDKLRALKDDVRRIKPDLICITGDIVDFPRKKHFLKAKEFIGILEQTARVYAVPGNHDALLGGPAIRRFKGHLDRDLEFGEHREIRGVDFCIFGFNSTFPSIRHFSNTGKITKRRLKRFRDRVKDLIEGTNRIGEFRYKNSYKIVLLHHHPVPTISSEAETMLYLRKAGEFLNEMARQDINIILHGHQHDPCDFSINYNIGGESDSMIILSAGTALKRLEFENGISKKTHYYILTLQENRLYVQGMNYHVDTKNFIPNKASLKYIPINPIARYENEIIYRIKNNGDLAAQGTERPK